MADNAPPAPHPVAVVVEMSDGSRRVIDHPGNAAIAWQWLSSLVHIAVPAPPSPTYRWDLADTLPPAPPDDE